MDNSIKDLPPGKQRVAALLKAYVAQDKKKRNLTRLAEKTGLNRVTLSRIVNGHFLPDPDSCQRLAAATGLEVAELLQAAGHLPLVVDPVVTAVRPPILTLAQNFEPSVEKGENIYDKELALQFHQIGEFGPEDIAFFKRLLKTEIAARQERLANQGATSGPTRPPFARPRSGQADLQD